jgi:hypothetical protein
MADKLSVRGSDPIQKTKDDVPRLNASFLAKHDADIELHGEPRVRAGDMDYALNDSSYEVNDFSEWSFFKREQFHTPPVNMGASFLWNPDLLKKVKDQRHYKQFVPERTLTGYRETRQNLDRKKRAKRMLAIWRKSSTIDRSIPGGTEGDVTARSDVNSKLGSSPQRSRGKGGRRSVSPSKGKPSKSRSPSRER